MLGGAALACAALLFHRAVTPMVVRPVPWPDRNVALRLELTGFPDDRWWLVVRNAAGEGRLNLQEDEVPLPPRYNIYRTANGSVGVVAAGGEARFLVRVPSDVVPYRDMPRDVRDHVGNWHYLGVMAPDRDTGMTFRSVEALPECIPLLGQGRPPPGREAAARESCGP